MHYRCDDGEALRTYKTEDGRVYFRTIRWAWSGDIVGDELVDHEGDIYLKRNYSAILIKDTDNEKSFDYIFE